MGPFKYSPDKNEEKDKRNRELSSPTSIILPPNELQDMVRKRSANNPYRLLLEYKHLKENSPRGIYVVPSIQYADIFHGVIFIRRGIYKNAVLKFKISLPPDYNHANTWPKVQFFSDIFHPYVDPGSGEIDLKIGFPLWDPNQHSLLSVVMYVKKMFFLGKFGKSSEGNYNAWLLSSTDPVGHRKKVYQCVDDSQRVVKDDPGSSLIFHSQEDDMYETLWNAIKTYSAETVTGDIVLDLVSQMESTKYLGGCFG